MNDQPKPPLGFRDFLNDLRHADPLFWLVAALVALCFLGSWLTR